MLPAEIPHKDISVHVPNISLRFLKDFAQHFVTSHSPFQVSGLLLAMALEEHRTCSLVSADIYPIPFQEFQGHGISHYLLDLQFHFAVCLAVGLPGTIKPCLLNSQMGGTAAGEVLGQGAFPKHSFLNKHINNLESLPVQSVQSTYSSAPERGCPRMQNQIALAWKFLHRP